MPSARRPFLPPLITSAQTPVEHCCAGRSGADDPMGPRTAAQVILPGDPSRVIHCGFSSRRQHTSAADHRAGDTARLVRRRGPGDPDVGRHGATPVTRGRRDVGGPAPGALVGEGGPGSIGSNEGPPHPRLVWVRGTFTQSPPGRAWPSTRPRVLTGSTGRAGARSAPETGAWRVSPGHGRGKPRRPGPALNSPALTFIHPKLLLLVATGRRCQPQGHLTAPVRNCLITAAVAAGVLSLGRRGL